MCMFCIFYHTFKKAQEELENINGYEYYIEPLDFCVQVEVKSKWTQ